MKILLLNQTFYPDVVATGQYLAQVAVALAERGHTVTVIASRRAYNEPNKLFPKRETWRWVEIHRIATTRFGKGAKWRRAADFASFIVACCWRLLWLPRSDVVVDSFSTDETVASSGSDDGLREVKALPSSRRRASFRP